jgi:TonB family protein
MDRNHPWKLEFPPQLFAHGEKGVCVIRFQGDVDGVIRASEIVSSTGFKGLDAACAAAVAQQAILPETIGGKPVTRWATMPIFMNTKGDAHKDYRKSAHSVPWIEDTFRLEVGPNYYPDTSRGIHQEGDCTVRVLVSEGGSVSDVSISKSTGFAPLDAASITAVQHAVFIPALRDGAARGGYAEINLSWRLPTT